MNHLAISNRHQLPLLAMSLSSISCGLMRCPKRVPPRRRWTRLPSTVFSKKANTNVELQGTDDIRTCNWRWIIRCGSQLCFVNVLGNHCYLDGNFFQGMPLLCFYHGGLWANWMMIGCQFLNSDLELWSKSPTTHALESGGVQTHGNSNKQGACTDDLQQVWTVYRFVEAMNLGIWVVLNNRSHWWCSPWNHHAWSADCLGTCCLHSSASLLATCVR